MDEQSMKKVPFRALLKHLIVNRRWQLVALSILAVVVVALYESTKHGGPNILKDFTHGTTKVAPALEPLHVLMPAPESRNLNLCKTILSGAILEYPTPHLLHWNRKWDKSEWRRSYHDEGLIKLTAARDYLACLQPEREQDLVLIVDPQSTWFQLSPNLLVERYHIVTREANSRLAKQLSRMHMTDQGIEQTVLFGVSKECGCVSSSKASVCCSAAPISPLPDDMYGADTDTANGFDQSSSFRPRYLDTGFIMGPAVNVRAVIERARDKRFKAMWDGKVNTETLNDQTIMSDIFAEQERHRASLVFPDESAKARLSNLLDRLLAPFRPDHASAAESHLKGHQNAVTEATSKAEVSTEPLSMASELGIHLDYTSSLSHSTTHSINDGHWLRYELVPDPLPDLNSASCKAKHGKQVPGDILHTPTPGTDLGGELGSGDTFILPPAKWSQMTLYTDICTGTVPALINHNDGDLSNKDSQWRWLWVSRFAQALLKLQQRRAAEMVDAQKSADGVNTGGAWLDDKETQKIEWWDLCEGQGFERNLFVQ